MGRKWEVLLSVRFFIVVSVIFLELNTCEALDPLELEVGKKHHPVIYVPGLGGSPLVAKVDDELLDNSLKEDVCSNSNYTSYAWLGAGSFFDLLNFNVIEKEYSNCLIEEMKLHYNNNTRKTSNTQGVEISVPEWGNPDTVNWLVRTSLKGSLETLYGKAKELPEFIKHDIMVILGNFEKIPGEVLDSIKSILGRIQKIINKIEDKLNNIFYRVFDFFLPDVFKVSLLEEIKHVLAQISTKLTKFIKFVTEIPKQLYYFEHITKALEEVGLESNKSIRSAPYDFRKAVNEQQNYFIKLKNLVEETYRTNNNTPVVLLVHSMGAPMILHFLHQQPQPWKDEHIKAMISLAGAWGGSAKAVKMYIAGDTLDIPFASAQDIQKVMVSTPVLAWMMPSRRFWHRDIFASTPLKNYTALNIKQFFQDINQTLAFQMHQDVSKYIKNFTPPDVEVHCLYGNGVETTDQVHFNNSNDVKLTTSKNGDGTVNLRSLEGCKRWEGKQKKEVYHKVYEGVDHFGILNQKDVIEYIKKVVLGEK